MKNLSISIEILFKVKLRLKSTVITFCRLFRIPYQYCTLTVTANTVDSILLMEEEDKTEKGHY